MRAFQNSGYDESGAARNKNSMRGWLASSKTPQEDIDKNIPVLRQRSRSLFMSAPLAVSAIKTNRTNIVGEGLRLKSTIDADLLGLSMDEAAAWQRAAERHPQAIRKRLCGPFIFQKYTSVTIHQPGHTRHLLNFVKIIYPCRITKFRLRPQFKFTLLQIRTRKTGFSTALKWTVTTVL